MMGFAERVYLGAEANIPNWFSTLLLLACGVVLLTIGAAAKQHVSQWSWLGIVFLALSLDESAALHDLSAPLFTRSITWLARTVGGPFSGLQYKPGYAWLIPGILFTAAIAVISVPLLLALPRQARYRFVMAGAIYVGGAVGFEALAAEGVCEIRIQLARDRERRLRR
jgi:hypothetical protein